MNPKYRRLIVVILILSTLGLATKLILMALKDNIIYFYSPNDLKLKYGKIENIKNVIRVGGLVLEESVKIKGNKTIFEITDRTHQIKFLLTAHFPIYSEKVKVLSLRVNS